MKLCAYLVVSIFALSRFSATAHPNFQSDQVRVTIMAKINAIPEVKKFLHDYPAISPRVIIARNPIPGFNYYLVKVGMGNDDRTFQANQNYCVDPKTFQVYYLDKMTELIDPRNAVITLEQWRRWRSTPNFPKMHTYKNGKLVLMNSK